MAEKISGPSDKPQYANRCFSSLNIHETAEEDVARLIEDLSDNKAIQDGDIQIKFIKLSNSILAPILTHIFNRCTNEGTYPNCFKISQITPICKSGDQTRCTNYRPISILLQFNKIFENILHTRVYSYLQEFNLLSKHQYGYRPRSTTTYAVETIHSTLLNNSDNGLCTCSVFIDLSKAFDTVNFKIILEQLYFNFGIRGMPLKLFTSYLSNRRHYTTIKNTKSQLANISCGESQGSVLGPLLFIMCLNYLPNCSAFKTVLYANDTYLSLSHKNVLSWKTW